MKKALIIIVIAVAAVVGYWLVQDTTPPAPAPEPVTAPEEPLAPAEAPEETVPEEPAEDPVAEPVEEDALLDEPATEEPSIVDQAIEEADEAAEAAEAAIADILEAQEEAAAEAEAAAQAAIEEALAAGDEAAAEAEAVVGEAQQAIQDQMQATEPEAESMLRPNAADPAVLEADAEGLFTPEGFDFERAMAAIEEADLDPINTSAARALLESVRDDPDALEAALSQLRDMLGL